MIIAFASSTKNFEKVDKIVGPNVFVATAKEVFGEGY